MEEAGGSREAIARALPKPDDTGVEIDRRSETPARLTCVLIDDHEAVLSALASLLHEEGFAVVGVARTGAEAVQLLTEHAPHFAVLDFRLPDMTGLEVARESVRLGSPTVLVLYTAERNSTLVSDALSAGVRGIVLKDVSPVALVSALEVALAGDVYVDPALGAAPG